VKMIKNSYKKPRKGNISGRLVTDVQSYLFWKKEKKRKEKNSKQNARFYSLSCLFCTNAKKGVENTILLLLFLSSVYFKVFFVIDTVRLSKITLPHLHHGLLYFFF